MGSAVAPFARAAVMIGPERLPADAFSDEEWQRLASV
jgi:hypothetical protein